MSLICNFGINVGRHIRMADNDSIEMLPRLDPADVTDQEMVLEPKYTDYGSIQSSVEPTSQPVQHNTLHSLLNPRIAVPPTPLEDNPPKSTTSSMKKGDLYQRQPLLANNSNRSDTWGAKPGKSSANADSDYSMDEEEGRRNSHKDHNGLTKIDMPPLREEPRFPQERWKTVLAALWVNVGFLATLISLSIIHDRVPKEKPLPDVILNNVPEIDPALNVSEYLIVFNVVSTVVCVLFHKHRFIVARRIFLLLGVLYLYRAITMFVTVLPIASKDYPCAPELSNTTTGIVVQRVVRMSAGFGLTINGDQIYCGDSIYSGHTVILVLSYLIISEYSPKKLWFVGVFYWLLSVTGVIMLEMSHAHYTIDVIIAYFITTRTFWLYHTLANNQQLKQRSTTNFCSREWWFHAFLYFERNVEGQVPNQYNWPFPWPKSFHTRTHDR